MKCLRIKFTGIIQTDSVNRIIRKMLKVFFFFTNFCRLLFFGFCCIKIFVISVFIKRRFGLCSFWTFKLLFLYSNTCYSLFKFFFPALQFFLLFGITKKNNCYSFVFFFFISVIHLLQFLVSVRYYKEKKIVTVLFFFSFL